MKIKNSYFDVSRYSGSDVVELLYPSRIQTRKRTSSFASLTRVILCRKKEEDDKRQYDRTIYHFIG